MLPLPTSPTDTLKLADWLELSALLAADRNFSKGDLERVLRRSGVLENQGPDAVDNKCIDVFSEIDTRRVLAAPAYPFEAKPGLLLANQDPEDCVVYLFCLCLSFFNWTQRRRARFFPRQMFEALSAEAAKLYLGGEALLFASPRKALPPSFIKAVDHICDVLGEGGGYRQQNTPAPKDDSVDIIAWKPLADTRPGKLLLFGQCASGRDTRSKCSDLQAATFCQQWMLYTPSSPLVHAFFIPHCVDPRSWEALTRRAGLVFDRPRLARLLQGPGQLPRKKDYVAWTKMMLRAARSR